MPRFEPGSSRYEADRIPMRYRASIISLAIFLTFLQKMECYATHSELWRAVIYGRILQRPLVLSWCTRYIELNGNIEIFRGLESDFVVTQFPGFCTWFALACLFGWTFDRTRFLIWGVCLRKIPIWKIVGSPWKEGEIRLEVDKTIFTARRNFLLAITKLSDHRSTKSLLANLDMSSVNQLNAQIKITEIWKAVHKDN